MTSNEAYYKARKAALKTYRTALEKHDNPYLPALGDIMSGYDKLQHVSLGLMQIPLSRIVGTVTRGRSSAFAANFMPLLEPGSEFMFKWVTLWESVSVSGVRQPITAVEYMGYYYLLEGNKRVSVAKALACEYIEADVTRYMAPKSDTPESKAYYAYVEFTKYSGVYDILFSDGKSYSRLTRLTGHERRKKWSDEDTKYLRANYLYFSERYTRLCPQAGMSVSDAFLAYIVAYGYAQISEKSFEDLDRDVEKMRGEFTRPSESETMNLILDKDEVRSAGIIRSLFGPSRIKAAFMYTRPVNESGWNHWHDIGRLTLENELGDRVETGSYVTPSRTEFDEKVSELINNGTRLIFATSPVMLNSCIKPSLEHPEARLLCCSPIAGYTNVPSYYLRTYEAKFLLGLAAGTLARGGDIGYVADYPICGAAASINAFARGVKMVSPESKVYLDWFTRENFDPALPFGGKNVRVICNRDITSPSRQSEEYGLYTVDDGKINNMAMPVYDWGEFYCHIARMALDGTLDDDKSGLSALNYWWGISSGALDIQLTDWFDPYAARLINHFKTDMAEGRFTPFEGYMRDREGNLRCGESEMLTPAEVLCMDWLAENVVGSIPGIDELTEQAKPLARLQGPGGEFRLDVSRIGWR